MKIIDGIVDSIPEKVSFFGITSPGFGSSSSTNSGYLRITLCDPSERQRSQQEIADYLTSRFRKLTFARSIVTQEQTIQVGRRSGMPLQYVIQAQNLDKLKAVLPEFMKKAEADPMFQVVDLNLKFNKPEMTVTIDRDRARTLGVTIQDIAGSGILFITGNSTRS